jgi:hypothetical protein
LQNPATAAEHNGRSNLTKNKRRNIVDLRKQSNVLPPYKFFASFRTRQYIERNNPINFEYKAMKLADNAVTKLLESHNVLFSNASK